MELKKKNLKLILGFQFDGQRPAQAENGKYPFERSVEPLAHYIYHLSAYQRELGRRHSTYQSRHLESS